MGISFRYNPSLLSSFDYYFYYCYTDKARDILADSNVDSSHLLPSVSNYNTFAATNNNHNQQPQNLTEGPSSQNYGQQQKGLPMEIDLSEFMLDTDLDFFNPNYDPTRHVSASTML